MEAIDLCNSDSEDSVALSQEKSSTIDDDSTLSLPNNNFSPLAAAIHITGAKENIIFCFSGSDKSKRDNNSLLTLEESSLKSKGLKIRDTGSSGGDGDGGGGGSEHNSSETKSSESRKNAPPRDCDKHDISELAEPYKKRLKRPLEVQCAAGANKSSNQTNNGFIELLGDTDEEHSKSSFADRCDSPSIRKNLFTTIQRTPPTLDTTSSDRSDDQTQLILSHHLLPARDNDRDQSMLKFHGSQVQLGASSGVVDLLSSGDERLSDSSPITSFTSSKPLPLHTIYRSDATTAQPLDNTSNHDCPVLLDRQETKGIKPSQRPTNQIDFKNRSCTFACDSDSDDSSLLSPSCFARKPKSKKDSTNQLISRPAAQLTQERRTNVSSTTTSNLTSTKTGSLDLIHDSTLLSSSSFAPHPNFTKDSATQERTSQTRQECTNVSTKTSNLDPTKYNTVDPVADDLMSPTPNHTTTTGRSSGISGDGAVLNTPNTPMRTRDKIPTPRVPVRGIGGKLYPDFRNQFIKALITHAKITRRVIHQRGVLDSSIRAVNLLSIYRFPIRTAEAGSRIKGIGQELLSVLRDAEKECKRKPYNPPKGKFSSVAASTLVALLAYEEEHSGETTLCSMEELITRINTLTHHTGSNTVLSRNASYYLDKNTLDPGWMQVKKLMFNRVSAGLEAMIKERRKKDACQSGIVFELMEHGRKTAIELKHTLGANPVEAGPLRQLASDTVDEDFGNVTMSMDFREGGGSAKSLHKMCDLLDDYRVPYVVRNLKIADYVYFVGDKLAPILIERKSVDDVACSLADGRWKRQQRSMRKAQYVLGNCAERRCQICYLIEGDATKRIVHGGKVGRISWNQTLKDVENAIAELPSLGFSVMKSRSHMGSMRILTQIARDVLWKYRNRSITCKYTYKEFLGEVKRCDDKEGDPPSLREHQYPAAPVVDAVSLQLNPSASIERVPNNSDTADDFDESSSNDAKQKAEDLKKLSISSLKAMCKDRDEKVSGTKSELIKRLLDKRKPEILITRSRRDQYFPPTFQSPFIFIFSPTLSITNNILTW